MPLTVIERGFGRDLVTEMSGGDVLVFWSSPDPNSGEMWCPDCRETEEATRAAADASSLDVRVVHVGDRSSWKAIDNPFRQPPFQITSVPTILRINKAASVHGLADDSSPRLVDADCGDKAKLSAFFKS